MPNIIDISLRYPFINDIEVSVGKYKSASTWITMKTAAAIAEVKEIRFTILASSSLLSIYILRFSAKKVSN